MKFIRTPQFREDYINLSESEKKDVNEAFSLVSEALQGNSVYYRKFRIKKMEGHPLIWEGHIKINLVFTFQYENDKGKCIFRRIGTHDIYKKP